MGIYDNVKKMADERGVSIYRIERDTGISNGAVARWNESVPSSTNLMKVARYFGVTVESLLESEKKENAK